MDYRNRIGLYGTYLCATAGIGFTLPYLPLYLGQQGLSDRTIGWICGCAALAGLAQFPIGLWSDRLGTRKPFLVVALLLLTVVTMLLEGARGALLVGFLVTMFAENGICRAVVESLAGAEVTCLALPGERAAALGALRFWKPIGIIGVALFGSWCAEKFSVEAILAPLTVIQLLGVFAASLIHEPKRPASAATSRAAAKESRCEAPNLPRDPELWTFVAAMILFHVANAPGGVYLGLFLKRDLGASDSWLAYAFIAGMLAWMVVVWPAGWMADRIGRRALLILTWAFMALRLLIVALARTPGQIVINQVLDGVANGLFSVLAATWVADRLADSRRAGEAQVIVGTSLVFGSALGPTLAAVVVDSLGYRGLFFGLAGVGAFATAIVALLVPETLLVSGRMSADAGAISTNAEADLDVTMSA